MGVAAFGVTVLWKRINTTLTLKLVVAFAVIPALLLDLIHAHYPKLGHIVGFAAGWGISLYYLRDSKPIQDTNGIAS